MILQLPEQTGIRGQNIFSVRITDIIRDGKSWFYPTFLGDKYPTVDFMVDLLQSPEVKSFFFASVKAVPYIVPGGSAKLSISKQEVEKLISLRVPVYIFCIDTKGETGFFLNGNALAEGRGFYSFPAIYPMTKNNLKKLWNEVQKFWLGSEEMVKFVSAFRHE